ncbi:MAG: cobalamin-dependent protein [Ktedonobacteraceae bacterium]
MTAQGRVIDKPDLEMYSNTPMFNTKSVVQQTGVPGPTLRAWERRYTLLSPERANNTYRLYSERDVVMIRWLKERVDAGMAISQAVALFRHKHDATRNEKPPASAPSSSESSDLQSTVSDTVESDVLAQVTPLRDGQIQPTFPTIYSMRLVRERLVEAFKQFDETLASMIMGSMLAIYPLEQVCIELITPTMWQIGHLWADGMVTVSVEHFASNFFRALLTNLLHVTPTITDAPTAIVSCAPGEPHELAPLMLALFLRRSGIRVVYLGQNIEIEGLLQSVRKISPTLLCVSLTMPAHLPALIELAHKLEELPQPRPILAFGGRVFAYNSDMISQVPGVYLAGELNTIVAQLHTMIVA